MPPAMLTLTAACWASSLLGAAWASSSAQQCIPNQRGPACSEDAQCSALPGCKRCAPGGFCVDTALSTHGGCTSENKTFDFYLLVQGWPKSMCIKRSCPSTYAASNRWTLHGLWPSRAGAAADTYPCTCDKRPFEMAQVSSIEAELHQNWPSVQKDEPFWAHEWTKHGTCSNTSARVFTELEFFNTTLALRERHDILAGLQAASIAPNDQTNYTAQQIKSALKSVGGGFEPLLGCFQVGGVQYLHEVSYCLGKDLRGVHCDDSLSHLHGDEVSDCDAARPMVLAAPDAVREVAAAYV